MTTDEMNLRGRLFDSLRSERRELDRWSWQVPLAIYGAVGVVVGLMMRGAFTHESLIPIVFMVLGLLVVAGMFTLQRFHERRRYRKKEALKIVTRLRQAYSVADDIDVLPGSGNVTKMVREEGRWVPRLLGSFSVTAVGCAFLFLLLIVLALAGCYTATSRQDLVMSLSVLLGGIALMAGCCLMHHFRDPD